MDGKRFDTFTKSVAFGSRRSLIKAVAGVLGGAALGTIERFEGSLAATGRAVGQVCRKNGDCASNRCSPPDFSGRSTCLCAAPKDCPISPNKCESAVCSESGQCSVITKNCDDNNPCTIDSCDKKTGQCINTPKVCNDNNPCTIDTCDQNTGQCVYRPKNCDDNNPCTTDYCDRSTGKCINIPKVCNDNDACTRDSCDVNTGNCVYTPINCDDGDACTIDTCDANEGCVHTPRVCEPIDQCHTASCVSPTGCVSTPKADNTPCDDDDDETCESTCQNGVCTGTKIDFETDNNNCGGCGIECKEDEVCSGQQCVSLCLPQCQNKNCGDDGCGGSCGTCTGGNTCNTQTGLCTCTPDCDGKTCGSDGCGGSCGECEGNDNCIGGTCVPCLVDGTQCIGASCIQCCHSTKRNGLGNFYCGCVPEGVQCANTPNGPGVDVNCLNCCTPLNASSGTCPGGS